MGPKQCKAMHKATAHITEYLTGLIEADKQSYSLRELGQAGFPAFVIEQIRFNAEEQIRSELVFPRLKWDVAASSQTMRSWEMFVQNAVQSMQIPGIELRNIIEKATAELLKLLLQPRKALVDFIFGNHKTLGLAEIANRSAGLPVYKNYGRAVPLYMQKRNLNELTYERCKQLLITLDTRITANYKASDWLKVLAPLFELFNGKVPAELLVIFFEDKGLRPAANIFRKISISVSKNIFTELYSREDLMEEPAGAPGAAEEEEKAEAVPKPDGETGKSEVKAKSLAEQLSQKEEPGRKSRADRTEKEDKTESREREEDQPEESPAKISEAEEKPTYGSLNELFSSDSAEKSEENKEEELQEFRENLISILNKAKTSFDNVAGVNEPPEKTGPVPLPASNPQEPPAESETKEQEPAAQQTDEEQVPPVKLVAEESEEPEIPQDEDKKPMWARFLNEEHMAVIKSGQVRPDPAGNGVNTPGVPAESTEEENREIFVLDDELIIEDTPPPPAAGSNEREEPEEKAAQAREPATEPKPEPEPEPEKDEEPAADEAESSDTAGNDDLRLKVILRDITLQVVDELFEGSVWEYGEALEHLEQLSDWDEASKYIQQEIFNRTSADMFSQTAIEFIDRLQNYFSKTKWR